jgi:hypothetical protein
MNGHPGLLKTSVLSPRERTCKCPAINLMNNS